MSSTLDNLCGPGKPLQLEVPDANELAGLLRSGTKGGAAFWGCSNYPKCKSRLPMAAAM